MLACYYVERLADSIPIYVIDAKRYLQWRQTQDEFSQQWLSSTDISAETAGVRLLPDSRDGSVKGVLCCVSDLKDFWYVGNLPFQLKEACYHLEVDPDLYLPYAIAFGLGAYQFTCYKKPSRAPAKLFLPAEIKDKVLNQVESIYWVRDQINMPADAMGPTEFTQAVADLALGCGAQCTQIRGEDLLIHNYPGIYTVGRASDDPPCLLDMRWGDPRHPRLSLVGKGVCFDTGGLDLKNASSMQLMKKDMAGGAHVFGLARMIMNANLPVCLRVLVPVVENSIAGNAYRPGDVIRSRKGLSIEVGNTDAEGRIILADALTEAVSEQPDLIIDISTLTGAARIAVGTEISALFSNDDEIASALIQAGALCDDPIWRLPLFSPYRDYLNSRIADLNNSPAESYGGAITAALFLNEFVPDSISWMHLDLMAWNLRTRPGRPQGGEAMAIRALFAFLCARYQ